MVTLKNNCVAIDTQSQLVSSTHILDDSSIELLVGNENDKLRRILCPSTLSKNAIA